MFSAVAAVRSRPSLSFRRLAKHERRRWTGVGYDSKVYAVPFELQLPPRFRQFFRIFGAFEAGPLELLRCLGEIVFGPAIVRSRVTISYFKPTYLPTWRIDAEVRAKMNPPEGKPGLYRIQSLSSYFPGFRLGSLSKIPLGWRKTFDDAVPLRTSMLRLRDGEDINMVPYSLSPLSLPDMVKSLGNEVVSIDEEKNITYDPSTVEFTFLAAYPILIPVYLIVYTHQGGNKDGSDRTFRFLIRASNVLEFDVERLHFMPVDVQLPFALTRIGPIIPEKSDKGETPGKIPKASVARYLDKLILNHHFEPTEEEGGIDWDDLRIRTADKNERTSNLSWLNYSIVSPVAKAATKLTLPKIELPPEAKEKFPDMHARLTSNMAKGEVYLERLHNQANKLLEMEEMDKPDWLKEYEQKKLEKDKKPTEKGS